MDIAGQYNMARPHTAARRTDALAHAASVDSDRRRVFEDARARLFRQRGKAERIIERMNVEGTGEMHGAEITQVDDLLAHALLRPGLDVGTYPAHPLDIA